MAASSGRPETGMRYFNPASDPRGVILDHYTGVGEVLAIHQLDRVFALFNRQIRVKRGALFSLDDAKNNDLIFVGSPSENLTLLDIPGTQEFVFQRLDSGTSQGRSGRGQRSSRCPASRRRILAHVRESANHRRLCRRQPCARARPVTFHR